jgi:Protein of unknown function (DUF4058)
MPIHDWSRVPAGIFHDFHHALIEQIKRALNGGLLPPDYYALAEQVAAGLGPDVLTLHTPTLGGNGDADRGIQRPADERGGGLLLAPPKTRPIAEAEMAYYRRKKSAVAVRHVSGDRVVAVVEVVSPGNKSTRNALEDFVRKAADLLDRRVHLLIIDLFPPGRHDPQGIHGAIWDYIADQAYSPPQDKPLTLAAYEADPVFRAFVESVAVGDALPDMPLFLRPNGCVEVPLEDSYRSAWEAVPRRWKQVLEAPR